MLANKEDISNKIRYLVSTKRGVDVSSTQIGRIGLDGTFGLWILGNPYILGRCEPSGRILS